MKNGLDLLKQDHRHVEHLFNQFQLKTNQEDKLKIMNEIIKELSVHSVIEEQATFIVKLCNYYS